MHKKHLYMKKPIAVEAYQWFDTDGDHFFPAPGFAPPLKQWTDPDNITEWKILTAEGWMNLNDGGFIVKGPGGEYWQVREDIFLNTYSAVPQEDEKPIMPYKACRQDMIERGEEFIPRSCPRCGIRACQKRGNR